MYKPLITLALLISSIVLNSQTVGELIEQVSRQGAIQMVLELSGEKEITLNGRTNTITHRVSQRNNDLAADYISEKLSSYGLSVENIAYRDGGRNVVATQTGNGKAGEIYVICAHYDSVENGGADDNASGTAAVIEAARILSNYSFEYTIKYALWDEEELGLIGARDYATKAAANGDNILAVLNMDMIGYDGNQNKRFDIDVRNVKNSRQISTDLMNVVSEHGLDLVGFVVDPGTPNSDHATFWDAGYSAALLGEGWSEDDITPGYHNINDRISLMNLDYFYSMVKLVVGWIATKAELLNSVSTNAIIQFPFKLYPNPTNTSVNIELDEYRTGAVEILSIEGKTVLQQEFQGRQISLDLKELESSILILKLSDENGPISYGKIVVE